MWRKIQGFSGLPKPMKVLGQKVSTGCSHQVLVPFRVRWRWKTLPCTYFLPSAPPPLSSLPYTTIPTLFVTYLLVALGIFAGELDIKCNSVSTSKIPVIWSSTLTAAIDKADKLWRVWPKNVVLKLGETVACTTRKVGLLFTNSRPVDVEVPFGKFYDGGTEFVLNMTNSRSVYLFSWSLLFFFLDCWGLWFVDAWVCL